MAFVPSRRHVRSASRAAAFAFAALAPLAAAMGSAAAAAPHAQPLGTDLGAADQGQILHATVWLARRDEAGFQAALREINDPASPRFHHWLTPAEYQQFMPGPDAAASLRAALAQAGLTIEAVAADNGSIAVSANAATMARAFGTTLHNFQRNGRVVTAATTRPDFAGPQNAKVAAITGLSGTRLRPFALRQIDPVTQRPVALPMITGTRAAAAMPASSSPLNPYLTTACYPGNTVQQLIADEGQINLIGKRQVNGLFATGTGYGVCGYDAAQMRAHYGLTGLISHGIDGTGQTIGIVVAYGSPFITSDVNAYASILGLPQLGAANFHILNPLGNPQTYDPDWSLETTIDVSMAHAIAPGAKIVLLVSPSDSTTDLLNTFSYAVKHQLADVVSMSFGAPEYGSDGSDEEPWGLATAEASSYGIGVTVSSGDAGDNGAGQPQGAPSTPADSAYVTAVGGTTLAFPTAEGRRDVGWGWQETFPNSNKLVKLKLQVSAGSAIGAGGGESVYFGKPYWQDALPGQGRQVPDIAAIADPLTGADLVLTINDDNYLVQIVTVAGGTSVAAPVFAGMSALANQRAGARIGQVAPLLAGLQGPAIKDILPLTAQDPKMSATLHGKPLTTPDVTPDALALLPEGVDAIEQIFVVRPVLSMTIFTYGLDTSLTTAAGWDNITGYGEPNGSLFITGLAKAAKGVQ